MGTEETYVKTNKTILVILGPSASGKTNFALKVAKALNKNIISADSRQVYKNLDYPTGKFPSSRKIKKGKKLWEINKIKYYGYDIIKPYKEYSAYDFARFANRIIKREKDNPPIICGGTGMYINALINNYDYKTLPANWELRKALKNKSSEELLHMLKEKGYDIELLNNSGKHNKQRLIRRIETYQIFCKNPDSNICLTEENNKGSSLVGRNPILKQSESVNKEMSKTKIIQPKYKYLLVGLEKESYDESINNWIENNFENSVKEVKWAFRKYPESPVFKGFIFSEIKEYLENKLTTQQTKEKIFLEYKHYIKRQKTYFKKYFPTCAWFTFKEKAFDYIKNKI